VRPDQSELGLGLVRAGVVRAESGAGWGWERLEWERLEWERLESGRAGAGRGWEFTSRRVWAGSWPSGAAERMRWALVNWLG